MEQIASVLVLGFLASAILYGIYRNNTIRAQQVKNANLNKNKEVWEKIEQENVEFLKGKRIIKTKIVASTSDSRKKVGSSVVRGAVGGAILGPVGLVGGAISAKNKTTNTTTFLIEYQDGHRETITVNNNSYKFEELCKYLEM